MKAQPAPARAGLVLDLEAIARALHAEEARAEGTHAARTILREPDLRVVVLAMAPGAMLAEHHANDTVTIQVLHGHVRLTLAGRIVELVAHGLIPLEPGLPHDVVAITRSALVLTLARRPERAG